MRGKRSGWHVFIAAALIVLCWSIALADEWTTYVNPRFGTRAEVPLNKFHADRPPENGDGQSWTSVDGEGRISVYGSYLVVADTLQGYREFSLNTARKDGVAITYSAGGRNWFSYSGTQGSVIVYMKALLSKDCDPPIVHHIYLRYPAAQREGYDAIVARMAKSLRAGRAGDCN